MKTIIQTVEFARERVNNWRANDGGLTHAATDLIGFARNLTPAIWGECRELSAAEQDVIDFYFS